jgi:hypothetical protein
MISLRAAFETDGGAERRNERTKKKRRKKGRNESDVNQIV